MTYREKIHRAQTLLKEAQEEADGAGDYATGDEVGYALACCRSAEIMAPNSQMRRLIEQGRP